MIRFLLLTFMSLVTLHGEEVICPSHVTETPVVSEEAGWVVVAASGKRYLEYAGLYFGHPSQRVSLVPDDETSFPESSSWSFPEPTEGLWIGCHYTGTTAMMSKRLDIPVSKCTATYDLLPSGKRLRLMSMVCE